MNLWQRLTQFFGGQPAEERAQLSETENDFLVGATPLAATEFDRPAYSRQELLQQYLDAWRGSLRLDYPQAISLLNL
jgi:hypothetical protein